MTISSISFFSFLGHKVLVGFPLHNWAQPSGQLYRAGLVAALCSVWNHTASEPIQHSMWNSHNSVYGIVWATEQWTMIWYHGNKPWKYSGSCIPSSNPLYTAWKLVSHFILQCFLVSQQGLNCGLEGRKKQKIIIWRKWEAVICHQIVIWRKLQTMTCHHQVINIWTMWSKEGSHIQGFPRLTLIMKKILFVICGSCLQLPQGKMK